MMIRRSAAPLVLLGLLLAAPAPHARASEDPKTLTYALSSDFDSLDPDWAYDATSQFPILQMYEGLVGFEGSAIDRFAPLIASVVPTRANGFLSADGMTYAFPLRGGVKFHDGTTMTADDVKYSLMRFMLTDRDGGPSALLLEPLTGRRTVKGADGKPDPEVYELADKAVSVEGNAVVLRLQQPFAPLLSVLAGFAPIVSRAYVAAHGGWDGRRETWAAAWNVPKEKRRRCTRATPARDRSCSPAGTARAKRLTLARFESYWRSPATLSRAVLMTVEEPKTRRRMLESGDADVAQLDSRSLPYFQAVPGAVVDTGLPLLETNSVIFFNFKIDARDNPWLGSGRLDGQGIPPDFFADREVRKAFAFAFDDDAYIRDGFQGAAVRARGPIPIGLGYAMPGHDTADQHGLPFSLDESAKSLRSAHGGDIWANGFLLPMAYPEGNPDRRLACRLMAEGLAKVNPKFRVDCRGIAQTKLLDELLAHRLSAFVYRWVLDFPDPDNAVEPFLHSTGFFASSLSYSNPRADAMIEQAAAESDPNARKREYSEIVALAIYDVPEIFTVDTTGAIARRVKVQNWSYNPMEPAGMLYEVTKFP